MAMIELARHRKKMEAQADSSGIAKMVSEYLCSVADGESWGADENELYWAAQNSETREATLQDRIEVLETVLDRILPEVITWDVIAEKMKHQGNNPRDCDLGEVLCAARKLVRAEIEAVKGKQE